MFPFSAQCGDQSNRYQNGVWNDQIEVVIQVVAQKSIESFVALVLKYFNF